MSLYPRSLVILNELAANDGTVSKWSLIDRFWPGSEDDTPLRMHIAKLRAHLGHDAIQTQRGVGYQLTDKGRAAFALMGA